MTPTMTTTEVVPDYIIWRKWKGSPKPTTLDSMLAREGSKENAREIDVWKKKGHLGSRLGLEHAKNVEGCKLESK